ncbi:MAG: serine/threonine-protein phosphatase [Bacteroidetes Order II. Incertae sedis bacterium]|nr:serine/threonine-protein phosphatase [Bacteroidetes Order II. bacterium]
MQVFPQNAQHIGQREQQQDAFGFSDLGDVELVKNFGALVVVADGMGGMAMGQEASNLAKQVVLHTFAQPQPGESPADLLLRATHAANEAVYQMANAAGLAHLAGTTLVAAVVKDLHLYWISVGDSRIFLYRRQELAPLNIEHVYSRVLNQQVKAGILTIDQAALNPEKNALTSFIGMANLVEIDRNVHAFPLEEGDVVLLCSDGLHGTLNEHEIADVLDLHPNDAAEHLVQLTLDRNHPHQDNVTVALLKVGDKRPQAATKPGIMPPPMPHTPKKNPYGFWMLGILGLLLMAGSLWWWLAGTPDEYVYAGKRPGASLTDVRGHFLQAGTLTEGTVEWKNDPEKVYIQLGGPSLTIPGQPEVVGIVRSAKTGLDQLVFQNRHKDSLVVVFAEANKLGLIGIAGKVGELESMGYFFIDPALTDQSILADVPEAGKLMLADRDFMPKQTNWMRYVKTTTDAQILFAHMVQKASPDSLVQDGKLWTQKIRLNETLVGRFNEMKNTIRDDRRFIRKDLSKNDKWHLEGLAFSDVKLGFMLLMAHDLTLSESYVIGYQYGRADGVRLPSVAFLRPDQVSITFEKPETKLFNVRLQTGEWAIN